MDKSPDAFRTISEVAEDLAVPQHVLRFWETRFAHIRPLKRGGGRRYYRPDDVELLKGIRQLLYGQGYTIRGVQRILKKEGVRFVQSIGRGEQAAAAPEPEERDASYREAQSLVPAADPPADGDAANVGLSDEDLDLLQAALAELAECDRVLRTLKAGAERGTPD